MSRDTCCKADPMSCGGRNADSMAFAGDVTTQLAPLAHQQARMNAVSAARESSFGLGG